MTGPDFCCPPLLVAEDSEDDIFLLIWALRKNLVPPKAHFVKNGAQAITYLEMCLAEKLGSSQLPRLMLLDIKMPLVNGHEVLAWIRSQTELRKLPVYMLSSSGLESDISKAQKAGASGYWVKPSTLDEFVTLADRIHELLTPLETARPLT